MLTYSFGTLRQTTFLNASVQHNSFQTLYLMCDIFQLGHLHFQPLLQCGDLVVSSNIYFSNVIPKTSTNLNNENIEFPTIYSFLGEKLVNGLANPPSKKIHSMHHVKIEIKKPGKLLHQQQLFYNKEIKAIYILSCKLQLKKHQHIHIQYVRLYTSKNILIVSKVKLS